MYKLLSQKFWTEDAPCHFEFRNPQPPYPLHCHDFHEIAIVYSGTGIHMTPDTKRPLKTGDVISVKPGQIHGYNKVNELILMNILIRPSFLTDENANLPAVPGYADLFQKKSSLRKNEAQSVTQFKLNKLQLFEIRAIIESMQKEIVNQNLSWTTFTTAYLIQLLILLLRIYNDPSYPDSANKTNAATVVNYVERNYEQNLTMQDLMDISAMSESSVLRTFKRITGYPPFVFQMRLRIFAAINELTSTTTDITGISYNVGFNDSNYFSRIFKKFTGLSPSEYRKEFTD
ncbi:MAG: helix-turn-helix domain-containing protein [Treponema sp.]|jgi:AraC family L-rhamnose operon transcriptional activator RhaR/AraC family L-rhamnose operon regulatory protein RhaS|nr:helix-turn-helix domain-containing protein [Treponema sp.]